MIAESKSCILVLIDDTVEHASDDELSANGYLHGHLTPVAVELGAGEDRSTEALYANVTSSLERAISAGELLPRNRALVKEMRDTLFQKATQ